MATNAELVTQVAVLILIWFVVSAKLRVLQTLTEKYTLLKEFTVLFGVVVLVLAHVLQVSLEIDAVVL